MSPKKVTHIARPSPEHLSPWHPYLRRSPRLAARSGQQQATASESPAKNLFAASKRPASIPVAARDSPVKVLVNPRLIAQPTTSGTSEIHTSGLLTIPPQERSNAQLFPGHHLSRECRPRLAGKKRKRDLTADEQALQDPVPGKRPLNPGFERPLSIAEALEFSTFVHQRRRAAAYQQPQQLESEEFPDSLCNFAWSFTGSPVLEAGSSAVSVVQRICGRARPVVDRVVGDASIVLRIPVSYAEVSGPKRRKVETFRHRTNEAARFIRRICPTWRNRSSRTPPFPSLSELPSGPLHSLQTDTSLEASTEAREQAAADGQKRRLAQSSQANEVNSELLKVYASFLQDSDYPGTSGLGPESQVLKSDVGDSSSPCVRKLARTKHHKILKPVIKRSHCNGPKKGPCTYDRCPITTDPLTENPEKRPKAALSDVSSNRPIEVNMDAPGVRQSSTLSSRTAIRNLINDRRRNRELSAQGLGSPLRVPDQTSPKRRRTGTETSTTGSSDCIKRASSNANRVTKSETHGFSKPEAGLRRSFMRTMKEFGTMFTGSPRASSEVHKQSAPSNPDLTSPSHASEASLPNHQIHSRPRSSKKYFDESSTQKRSSLFQAKPSQQIDSSRPTSSPRRQTVPSLENLMSLRDSQQKLLESEVGLANNPSKHLDQPLDSQLSLLESEDELAVASSMPGMATLSNLSPPISRLQLLEDGVKTNLDARAGQASLEEGQQDSSSLKSKKSKAKPNSKKGKKKGRKVAKAKATSATLEKTDAEDKSAAAGATQSQSEVQVGFDPIADYVSGEDGATDGNGDDKGAEELRLDLSALQITGSRRSTRLQDQKARKIKARQDKTNELKATEQVIQTANLEMGNLSAPDEPVLPNLASSWTKQLTSAMDGAARPDVQLATSLSNIELNRHAFGTCVPRQGDSSSGWLNDEIIQAYLEHIVNYGKGLTKNSPRPKQAQDEIPRYAAFSPQFWSNLGKKGPASVIRWANRIGLKGDRLLGPELIFIPINPSNHWTLLVVYPRLRLARHYDSMGNHGAHYEDVLREYLAEHLKSQYKEEEWTFEVADSPQQNNASDCGVFTVTTARMLTLGWDPKEAYGSQDMVVQRRRILCELMNGGLEGDFKPVDALAASLHRLHAASAQKKKLLEELEKMEE